MNVFKSEEKKTYLSNFLNPLFEEWENEGIEYCILRNYERLPYYTDNDIDIMVSDVNKATSIIKNLLVKEKWNIHRIIEYSCRSIYLFKWIDEKLLTIHIDLFSNFNWKSNIMQLGSEVLQSKYKYKNFYIISLENEIIEKLLIRLIYNGKIKPKYTDFINDNIDNCDKHELYLSFSNIFNEKKAEKLLHSISKKDFESINEMYKNLRRIIRINNYKKPMLNLKRKLNESRRLLVRMLKPKGKMIVILGSDGSGKTTVINNISTTCKSLFNNIVIKHWRPNLLVRPNVNKRKIQESDYSQPHKLKPYGKVISFFRFLYYNIDYILGYYFKVLPIKIRGGLFIFDRYYYDYYVDKQRYRMNLSDRTIRFFERIIPKPDVVILYTGSAETIHQRKEELTIDELKTQNDRILKLNKRIKNSIIVNCTQDIMGQIKETINIIIENSRCEL